MPEVVRYFRRHGELPSEGLRLPSSGTGMSATMAHHLAVYQLRLETGQKIQPEF